MIELARMQPNEWSFAVDLMRLIGFVSCEVLVDRLHLHTFQLAERVQRQRVGLYVLRRLEAQLLEPGITSLTCNVFKDHWARAMYVRMGFMEIASKGNLILLELPLIEGRCVLPRLGRPSTGPLRGR